MIRGQYPAPRPVPFIMGFEATAYLANLFQGSLPQCSRNTRSRSRSSTASRWAWIECSATLSRCENRWRCGNEVNSRTSASTWSSTKLSLRADWKLLNTSPAPCMTSTLSQNTRNSGRGRSGVFPMRLLQHSRNWIPFHSSRPRRSWANFLEARFSQSF